MEPEIWRLAESVSERLVDQGAQATLLTGSQARGQARPDSDVDLFAVGDGPRAWMEIVDGRLVAVYWWTAEETRRRMLNPAEALLAVRAWRDGVLIDDPTGVGEELQREAREWTWDKIEREADAWVCEQLVAQAEYLPKLTGALGAGRLLDAAALRGQLTVKLADLFAVRRRLTEESENGFWETIAEAGGPEWRDALERALRLEGDEARGRARRRHALNHAEGPNGRKTTHTEPRANHDHAREGAPLCAESKLERQRPHDEWAATILAGH